MPFETYKEADDYYNMQYNNGDMSNCKIERSTIIPVCKFVPAPLHPMILNYKLSKLFINAEIEKPMRF
jgi:hypothetical protein